MGLEIKVGDLRSAIDRIFDHIENDLRIDTVKLTEDNYWDVSDAERYDFTKSPTQLHSGQLYDDWQFLSEILRDKELAVAYMFVHATPILRYLAERIGR